ncbi:MYCBP-associated protein-like isoform X2 [Oscarella lobularis]|uniref:MYCBP-associated protein-like isoform X2 n=1 Tax=Oscarella lobularis TaxID=121494 RepID=UPI00331322B4
MATRLTAKQSKRDRPKSSNGKGPKGPGASGEEGMTSDPATAATGDIARKRSGANDEVIRGEDVDSLAIDLEEFRKTLDQTTSAPPPPQLKTVLLRKTAPRDEDKRPQTRSVTVARRAPPEAKPSQHELVSTKPRFNANGIFIEHSLLGSLEDYEDEAMKEADKYGLTGSPEMPRIELPTPSNEFADVSTTSAATGRDVRALENWNSRMLERKRQQGRISKLLQTTEDQLLMNKGSDYRQTIEQREIIDKAIPPMDYGKGYRIGSEFWRMQERIGDELTGINLTLTKTEKGGPPPLEQIGIPEAIQTEMGTHWPVSTTPMNYPWKASPYLAERSHQLNPVVQTVAPHQPDFSQLQVVGRTISLERKDSLESLNSGSFTDNEEEQDHPENPIAGLDDLVEAHAGPSLRFGGQTVQWEGVDDNDSLDLQPINARVTFTSEAGEVSTSALAIANDGTTAIYYSWKLIPKESRLDTNLSKGVQRFYFHTKSGVILPNDSLDFPFTFKSTTAGIFTETWQFETRPVLCKGAPLLVTLRGVALREDKFKKTRADINADIERKQAAHAVEFILNNLVDNIQTPPRVPSPVDADVTEKDIFIRNNPNLYCKAEAFDELQALWRNINAPDHLVEPSEFEPIVVRAEPPQPSGAKERGKKLGGSKESARDTQKMGSTSTTKMGGAAEAISEERLQEMRDELEKLDIEPWDLSVETIRKKIVQIENDNRREKKLIQLNKIVLALSVAPVQPRQSSAYNIGYELLVRWIDKVASQADHICRVLGLPEKTFAQNEPVEVEAPTGDATTKKHARPKTVAEKPPTTKKVDSKGGKRTVSSETDRPPSKGAKNQATAAATGRRSRTGSPTKKASAIVRVDESASSPTGTKSDVDAAKKEATAADPKTEEKFGKLLYAHVYDTLVTTLDTMSDLLSADGNE